MWRRLAVVVAALAVVEGAAAANPIVIGGTIAVQVPETFHVQVSYGCLSEVGESIPAEGYTLSRDGVPLAATWLGPTMVDVNAGSGLGRDSTIQVCDCDVPLGPHTYVIGLPPGQDSCAQDLTVDVTVKDPPPAPPEPWVEPDPEDYEYPWDIPEPPWPKGADCVAFCATAPPPPTDVAAPPADIAAPPADAPVSQTDAPVHSDGLAGETGPVHDPPATIDAGDDEAADCAVGGSSPLAPLALLALLLGLGLLRRRRPA